MITVIGSINMDLVTSTDIFPQQGETVIGSGFGTVPGGKGANQAVAAAKLGSKVAFIGAIGEDDFGEKLIQNLSSYDIDTSTIMSKTTFTGIANIMIHEQDNRIIVIPGANAELLPKDIEANWEMIARSKLIVLQLEIPKQTIDYILTRCNERQIAVLLNPAPAQHFEHSWIPYVNFLTPNEHECQQIFGEHYEQIVEKYPNKVIVTLGERGACYHDGQRIVYVDGCQVDVVDTTGAGDTFNGALAFAITNNEKLHDAVQFANVAASISVQQFGAQGGMPTFEQVNNGINKG